MLAPWKESYDQPRQHIKKQRHHFVNKDPSSQGMGFSSGHVWMWELDYKESWAQKNWCFWNVVLEKILESPLDCKEIQPAHPKGDQSWVFTGRTDFEAETPNILATWCKQLTHLKTLILGKIKGWKRRGWQRMRRLDGITDSMDLGLGGLQEFVMDRETGHAAVHEVSKSQTWLSHWTELNWIMCNTEYFFIFLLIVFHWVFCLFICFIISCMSSLYILEFSPLLVSLFANISS